MNGAGSLSPLIHLVDDDAAVRDALELLIGTVGLRVEQWASPERFLADFDRQSIGAIVLDIRMPGLSGLSVLDSLQAAGVDHPVIMLTGHGSIQSGIEAMKLGAGDFLQKPVELSELMTKIGEAKNKKMLVLQKQSQEELRKIVTSKSW